jgi:hypothetical protein
VFINPLLTTNSRLGRLTRSKFHRASQEKTVLLWPEVFLPSSPPHRAGLSLPSIYMLDLWPFGAWMLGEIAPCAGSQGSLNWD